MSTLSDRSLRWKVEVGVSYNGALPRYMLADKQIQYYNDKIRQKIDEAMAELRDELYGVASVSAIVKEV